MTIKEIGELHQEVLDVRKELMDALNHSFKVKGEYYKLRRSIKKLMKEHQNSDMEFRVAMEDLIGEDKWAS